MQTSIPASEASWLLTLLNDQDSPLRRPATPDDLERQLEGLEATVRLLVSIVDRQELAAAIRLQHSSVGNEDLLHWAESTHAPPELVAQAEERSW